MFENLNKKYLLVVSIIFITTGFGYYYFSNYKNIDIKEMGNNKVNIKINKEKKEIKLTNDLKDSVKKNINKYNYQVKIFLDNFELSCNGEKNICKKILDNKEKLNNFILGNYSGELIKLDEFKLNINNFFNKIFDKNIFKSKIIDLLYTFQNNLIKETNIKNTGFEKYFEFKKENPNDKIILNNMEIQCASEIKMSVIPGTFEEDTIIAKKVEENCKNLGGEKFLTLENNNKKLENNEINLILKIKKLKINYKFFEKKDGKYKEVESKEIFIDYEKIFTLKKEEKKTNTKKPLIIKNKESKKVKIDDVSNDIKTNKQKDLQKKLNKILKKKLQEKLHKILREKMREKLKQKNRVK